MWKSELVRVSRARPMCDEIPPLPPVHTLLLPSLSTSSFSLHFRIEEKLSVQTNRDGRLELEVIGTMHMIAASAAVTQSRIRVYTQDAVNPPDGRYPRIELQTNPNLDKKAFSVGLSLLPIRSRV